MRLSRCHTLVTGVVTPGKSLFYNGVRHPGDKCDRKFFIREKREKEV